MGRMISRIGRLFGRKARDKSAGFRRPDRICSESVGPPLFELSPFEQRLFLSFTASMSAPPNGVHGQAYTVYLATTGQQASSWVVHWGDTFSTTYNASSYTGGVFPQPLQAQHTYSTAFAGYSITATATSVTNATSTTELGLDINFGVQTFQDSGKSLLTPYGSTGDAKGEAIAVDVSGRIYAASIYNGNRMAVTRFNSQGAIDNTWGTQGTLVIPQFVTGTDTDTPTPSRFYRTAATSGSPASARAAGPWPPSRSAATAAPAQ